MSQASVILPCFNAEKYLPNAIESVLNQTYSDLEFIIIDDHSDDNTWDHIISYKGKDSRISAYRLEKNSGGPAEPRNLGISKAKGNYIFLIDADDIWHPEKLKIQINFLESNGIDFICSELTKEPSIDNFLNLQVSASSLSSSEITFRDLLKYNHIACSSVGFRRERNVRFNIKDKFIAVEDYLEWLRQSVNGAHFRIINFPLVNYRPTQNSISKNKFKMFVKYFYVHKEILKYSDKYKIYSFPFNLIKYVEHGVFEKK